jgi:hypothetical protein
MKKVGRVLGSDGKIKKARVGFFILFFLFQKKTPVDPSR